MFRAEKIAKEKGYEKMAVISGVGVREYYKKLESLSKIDNLNKFLKNLVTKNPNQKKILIKNFLGLNNISQLIDKLVEILVAMKFEKKNPIFFYDNDGNPDIYLEKTQQYIEVKRINHSDCEKKLIDKISKNKCFTGDLKNIEKTITVDGENKLFNKCEYHIGKAIRQLGKKNNSQENKHKLFLIYDCDFFDHNKGDINFKEANFKSIFKRKIEEIFNKKDNSKNIELTLIQTSELVESIK
jgi:hypothetical protein